MKRPRRAALNLHPGPALGRRFPPDAWPSVFSPVSAVPEPLSPLYRLELLPAVPPFHRRALRQRHFERGQLVFYGPRPDYYGIGEVKRVDGPYVSVDFRGTGTCGVHEDMLEKQYLIPLSPAEMKLI